MIIPSNLKYKEGIEGPNKNKLVKYEWRSKIGEKYSSHEGGKNITKNTEA